MREGGGEALAPIILPLVEKGFDEQSARVTEDRDEEKDAHPLARDPNALLAKIDLQLIARRALDTDRRELRRTPRSANVCHRALNRPHADIRAAVFQEPLDDDGIATGASLVQRPRLTSGVVAQS